MNNQAKRVFGTELVDNPYGLFLMIPSLLKVFFPNEVQKMSKLRRHRMNGGYMNSASNMFNHKGVEEIQNNLVRGQDGMNDNKKFGINFKTNCDEFLSYIFPFMVNDLKRISAFRREIGLNPLENFNIEDIEDKLSKNKSENRSKQLNYFELANKLARKNSKLIQTLMNQALSAYSTLTSFEYRNQTYKVLKLTNIIQAESKHQKFFKVSLESLQDSYEALMTSPDDINSLCKLYIFLSFLF